MTAASLIARARRARAVLIVLAAAGLAAACAPTRPPQPVPTLAFPQRPPVALDVARVEVVNDYVSPMASPHVEQFAPTPPAAAVRRWADERLRAEGLSGTLRVVVEDARITETPLPRTGGLQGVVRRDETERYDGRLSVRLEAARGDLTGSFSAAAERSRTVPEGITLAEREAVLQEMVNAMAEEVDRRLVEGLSTTLAPFAAPRR
jgi:hypothetical protein